MKVVNSSNSKKENDSRDACLIVIPVSGGMLTSHFGHCKQFAFIKTENGEVKSSEMRIPPPHEPGVLPQWLQEQGADVVIAGGIGSHAQQLLRESGIEVVIGAPVDSPETLANKYLNHVLVVGDNVCDH